MLVTFSCPVYADITMFGDIAVRMIRAMGHSGTIPGALSAEDVPAALKRLKTATQADEQSPAPAEDSEEGKDDEPPVSFSLRAWPLIELLKAAEKAKSHVMWDSNN
jgi:hypothetical protein